MQRCLRALCKVARLAIILLAAGCLLFPENVRADAGTADTVTVRIPVSCSAKGLEDQQFLVRLRHNVDNAQALELRLRHKETREFVLDFEADEVGEYYFTLLQRAGNKNYIDYDDSQYWVHISVTRTQGTLQADTVLWKDGASDKLAGVTFVNTRKESPGEDNNPGGSTGDGSSGDDSTNSGTGGGNNNGDDNNGGDDNNSGGSNGPGSGPGGGSDNSGSAGGGAGNGTGNGSTNGSGSGSGTGNNNGSGSFWGNGSFWGSSSGSTTGTTSGSSFWGSTFVRTGDGAPLARWAVTALIAIVLAAGLLLYKRNNEMRTDRKDREDG